MKRRITLAIAALLTSFALYACAYRDAIIAAAIGTADAIGCNVVAPIVVTTPQGKDLVATACDGRARDLLTDVVTKVANMLAARKGAPMLLSGNLDPRASTWAPVVCRGVNIGSVRAELRHETQAELDSRKECQP